MRKNPILDDGCMLPKWGFTNPLDFNTPATVHATPCYSDMAAYGSDYKNLCIKSPVPTTMLPAIFACNTPMKFVSAAPQPKCTQFCGKDSITQYQHIKDSKKCNSC